MTSTTLHIGRRLAVATSLFCLVAGSANAQDPTASKGTVSPKQFDTPEQAADSLITAAEKFDVPMLKRVLGSAGVPLVESKDTVRDRETAMSFAQEAQTQHRLEFDSSKTTAVLSVGATDWPVPMPIVKRNGKWAFDAAAGQEEILRRRIGRNELDAIQVCRGFVEAQRQYALDKHDGSDVNQYAQRIVSTPGKQDGLAWRTADSAWEGPVGERIARVIAEGYKTRYQPYHGYYFKVLKGQGPAAPLGQMDFVVHGAMIGGFALVAAPAQYGVTGVQTFIVSHNGVVYQQDLGKQTLDKFRQMERYNPDSTWTRVADSES